MVFLSICTALYDYVPQGEGEIAIKEGETILILERSTKDEWWMARRRASSEDGAHSVGLIPSNYVEEARPISYARALYDYSRQTDEELSFSEDSLLVIYDTLDTDWTLVGLNGALGFAPANYIEIVADGDHSSSLSVSKIQRNPSQDSISVHSSILSPSQNPVGASSCAVDKQITVVPSTGQQSIYPSGRIPAPKPQFTPEGSEDDAFTGAPILPRRLPSQEFSSGIDPKLSPLSPLTSGFVGTKRQGPALHTPVDDGGQPSYMGYHLYNVNESVSTFGKQKKLPVILGINLTTGGIMIAPQGSSQRSQQEWTAEKLVRYSIEGKHVFMDLVHPSKSVDLHAGNRDTAHEIVFALGELAGAAKLEGFREIIAASLGSGQTHRKGRILYDFTAQGDDEISVASGQVVLIIDDTKSEEWWMVRGLESQEEGVVPSSYIEVTTPNSPLPTIVSESNNKLRTTEQQRREKCSATDEVDEMTRNQGGSDETGFEVGPGVILPVRGSSLLRGHKENNETAQRRKRDNRLNNKSMSLLKSKPDATKTRTWTDRSGSFKVEAQFIGLKDGKIHLHKLNGVKIAVPVVKMAIQDLEYVEQMTGMSLDEDKPLADIRRRNIGVSASDEKSNTKPLSRLGITAEAPSQPLKPIQYDWFSFFLKCGVSPYHCGRYSSSFVRDSMDELVLPDITSNTLRTLGLKEGDILRVMKFLDGEYGGTTRKQLRHAVSSNGKEDEEMRDSGNSGAISPRGGLFSGSGGALKNNTSKGRPVPAAQTIHSTHPAAIQQNVVKGIVMPFTTDSASRFIASVSPLPSKSSSGFDDDAWSVKTPKQPLAASGLLSPTTSIHDLVISGTLSDLSQLSEPLQPNSSFMNVVQPLPQPLQRKIEQSTPIPRPAYDSAEETIPNQLIVPSLSNFDQLSQPVNGIPSQQKLIPQTKLVPSSDQTPATVVHSNFQLGSTLKQSHQAPQPLLTPLYPPRSLSAPQHISSPAKSGSQTLQRQLTGVSLRDGAPSQATVPGQSLNGLNGKQLQQPLHQHFESHPTLADVGEQTQHAGSHVRVVIPELDWYKQQSQISSHPGISQMTQSYFNSQQQVIPSTDHLPPPQWLTAMEVTRATLPSYAPNTLQPEKSANLISAPAMQQQRFEVDGQSYGQPQPGFLKPAMLSQPKLASLRPQKTGPAPAVSFGVWGDVRLKQQIPGRRADLSQATPQNPFGF